MSEDLDGNLQAIRDLISHGPVHNRMFSDLQKWQRLCDALDGVTDASTPQGRLEALNAARVAVGMDAVDLGRDDPSATLVAGLFALRATLEEEVNEHHRSFSEEPLASQLPNLSYATEKAAESVRSSGGFGTDRNAYNLVFVQGAREAVEKATVSALARGYDNNTLSDLHDLAYVFSRAEDVIQTRPLSDHELRDVEILVRHALPALVRDVQNLVQEIDEEFKTRRAGWHGSDSAP